MPHSEVICKGVRLVVVSIFLKISGMFGSPGGREFWRTSSSPVFPQVQTPHHEDYLDKSFEKNVIRSNLCGAMSRVRCSVRDDLEKGGIK